MSLTRKMLKAMSIEDEKIDQIIEAHSETVDALKGERDRYKADAEKLPDVQAKLDTALKNDGSDFKKKFEDEHKAFEEFKNQVETEKANSVKDGLYRDLLKGLGVDENRFDSILKVTDLTSMKVDDEGKLVDSDKLAEAAKADWSGFILEPGKGGANVPTPPSTPGGGQETDLGELSMEEYIAARQKDN